MGTFYEKKARHVFCQVRQHHQTIKILSVFVYFIYNASGSAMSVHITEHAWLQI